MLREARRSAAALRGAVLGAADDGAGITRFRAILQIVLTVLLLPLALFVLFGPRDFAPAARDAASALLGAIVTFWLKD